MNFKYFQKNFFLFLLFKRIKKNSKIFLCLEEKAGELKNSICY